MSSFFKSNYHDYNYAKLNYHDYNNHIYNNHDYNYYKLNNFISFSTVVMPPIPKFSTSTFTTLAERKPGKVGPR